VVVEGANNGGLLSKINGLSLFVPVSQLEKKGDKEWWTEQVGGQFAALICPADLPVLALQCKLAAGWWLVVAGSSMSVAQRLAD
jgi:hypothetical protein